MLKFLKYAVSVLIIAIIVIWISPFVYFYFQPKKLSQSETEDFSKISSELKDKETQKLLNQNLNPKKIPGEISANSPWFTGKISLNLGSKDGLDIGMAVTNRDQVVIGYVSDVDTESSRIITVTDPNFKFPVLIGKNGSSGVLSGLYGYSAEISWVKPGGDLNNQPVFTSKLSKNTVEGLLIGKSINPRIDKANSFYKVDVTDVANIWDTGGNVFVFIP